MGNASCLYAPLVLLLSLLACKAPPEEAVPDLDATVHWAWQSVETASPAEWSEMAAILDSHVGGSLRGTVSVLSHEEQALVPLVEPGDPDLALGLLSGGRIACDLAAVEKVVYALEQDEIFSGYTAYERTYTSDLDAYEAREVDTLGWHTTYSATVLATYTADIDAVLRWTADGPVLIERAWLPSPAVFESGSDRFDQDYQLQVFWPVDDGTTGYLYGTWRELEYAGLTLEESGVQNLILDRLEDWADELEAGCTAG